MNTNALWDATSCITMDPARIVRSQNVGLDSEILEVLRELQHSLYSHAPRGREIEADDQDLYGRIHLAMLPPSPPAAG